MLFDKIFKNPKRQNKDSFPSCTEWKKEIEKWLLFIQDKNKLEKYLPRLNASNLRDSALAEISSAYLTEIILKFPIIDWDRKTINDKDVDFVIGVNSNEIYCEVKNPGWESELNQKELFGGRKKLPKHINAETRSIAPWQAIRYAIEKSYPKFLPNCKNIVIIRDDLFLNILDIPRNIDIALFEDSGIYNGKVGYFSNKSFENVGGILIWDCRLINNRIEYRYKFHNNKNSREPFFIFQNS